METEVRTVEELVKACNDPDVDVVKVMPGIYEVDTVDVKSKTGKKVIDGNDSATIVSDTPLFDIFNSNLGKGLLITHCIFDVPNLMFIVKPTKPKPKSKSYCRTIDAFRQACLNSDVGEVILKGGSYNIGSPITVKGKKNIKGSPITTTVLNILFTTSVLSGIQNLFLYLDEESKQSEIGKFIYYFGA